MLYKKGFRNPRAGSPRDSRASLRKDTKDAKVGEAAEVPPVNAFFPFNTIKKF